MFVTVIALKHALLVSQWSHGHLLFQFNSRLYIVLYPQNCDRRLCDVTQPYVLIRPQTLVSDEIVLLVSAKDKLTRYRPVTNRAGRTKSQIMTPVGWLNRFYSIRPGAPTSPTSRTLTHLFLQTTLQLSTLIVHNFLAVSLLASAWFQCVEALDRIIIRGPYPPSDAIIYINLQL